MRSTPPPPYSDPSRVSLADVARLSGALLQRGDSAEFDTGAAPTLGDLAECLFFSPGDGRIWLNDQRMLLLHAAAIGTLRRELIDCVGAERARRLLTRAGYASGARDAELVRQRWPKADGASILAAGTRLHALEGVVKVEPVHFSFDAASGRYDGEFLWHHSSEADEHIAAYGIGTEPACWMELGYAMGYVTGLTGTLVIFREVECRAMGSAVCRVIGRNAVRWGDVANDLRYLDLPAVNAGDQTQTADEAKHSNESWRERLARSDDDSASVPRSTLPPQPAAAATAREPYRTEAAARSGLVGRSAAFAASCDALMRVAPTGTAVLLTGESGVGKELFAATLHRQSRRAAGAFVAVNCAALPETLVEAELFGVERGAFTGASQARAGRFERASDGTLFLDEIGSLPYPAQGKLLRALQEREIERVGGGQTLPVDVRVIAATNVDLREAVRCGRFREDLFFRLNVFPILIPPLRERRDDIGLLIDSFLHQFCNEHGRSTPGLTPRARRVLLNYAFPGNIRELRNMMERGVIAVDDGQPIDLPHLFRHEPLPVAELYSVSGGALKIDPFAHEAERSAVPVAPAVAAAALPAPISIDALEEQVLAEALARTRGNVSAAARMVGLTRAQFAYRIKKRGGAG
ncbi:sigma-54-dependent Fis family transcriptional regulator [Trinickia violacea]|uniref:Sigma-54-dependent Fis family transcriptional regulator n=1 Tax=Trinickia violacea TaxID=2571746 RepID=A0A4P8J237_9BURK|nr:sigma-54-dependent Fis family transcriptional regulator [Trinickia violacea]QCP54093.1 sigma-54-dependent Fis family transcriptional regulator [Trinickia violacea]